MICMKKIIILMSMIIFIVGSSGNAQATQDVGYELLDSNKVLHIWNEIDNYYFNTTSGMQFTNHYNEYWSHNVLCIGVHMPNGWEYVCEDELPFDWNIANTTNEVNVTGYKDKDYTYNGRTYTLRLGIRYRIYSNQTYMDIQPYIKNIGAYDIPYDIVFAWRIKDIQISNTEEGDYTVLDYYEYILNESQDIQINDLNYTQMFIHDLNTDEFIWMNWSENLSYWYNITSISGQYNAPNMLLVNIGSLIQQEVKMTTFDWIDALCGWTCYLNSPLTQQDIYTGNNYNQSGYIIYTGTGCSLFPTYIEFQYQDSSDSNWNKIISTTNISYSGSNPRITFCRNYYCGPESIFPIASEDNQDEGLYDTRNMCTFNGQTKYDSGSYINITDMPEPDNYNCPYDQVGSNILLTGDNYTYCFNITTNDVIFDCGGYTLHGNSYTRNNWTILAHNVNNVTIQNCNLKNWTWAIEFDNVNNSVIKTTNIFNTTDISKEDVYAYGIHIDGKSENLTIENVNITIVNATSTTKADCFSGDSIGISISDGHNISLFNTTIDNVHGQRQGFQEDPYTCNSNSRPTLGYNIKNAAYNATFYNLSLLNGRDSFYTQNVDNITIIDASFINVSLYGLVMSSTDYSFASDIRLDRSYYGIVVGSSSNTTMHNIIINNSVIGIDVGNSQNIEIENVLFENMTNTKIPQGNFLEIESYYYGKASNITFRGNCYTDQLASGAIKISESINLNDIEVNNCSTAFFTTTSLMNTNITNVTINNVTNLTSLENGGKFYYINISTTGNFVNIVKQSTGLVQFSQYVIVEVNKTDLGVDSVIVNITNSTGYPPEVETTTTNGFTQQFLLQVYNKTASDEWNMTLHNITATKDSDYNSTNFTIDRTGVYTIVFSVPEDSCTYSDSGDWIIDINDNCTKVDDQVTISGIVGIYGTSGFMYLKNYNITCNNLQFNASNDFGLTVEDGYIKIT